MNMKKLVLLLLTLVLVLASTMALAEEEKVDPTLHYDTTVHDNNCQLPNLVEEKNATCEEDASKDGYCRHFVEAVDGMYSAYIVEYPKKKPAHNYEWVETKELDVPCQEWGEEIQVCTECGKTGETRETEPKPHTWELVPDQEANCTQEFTGHYVCAVCGATGESVTGEKDPENHLWGEMKYDEGWKPTCCRVGKGYVICKRCGARQEQTVAQLPHKYTKYVVVVEPTCTTPGRYAYQCEYEDCCTAHKGVQCSAIKDHPDADEDVEDYVIPALGHKLDKDPVIVTDSDCLHEGLAEYYCERCGEKIEERTIPKKVHDWSEWQTRNDSSDASLGYKIRYCRICGTTEAQTYDGEDLPENTVSVDVILEPTCTEPGLRRITVKGEEVVNEEIPALGHDYVETTVDATCETAGAIVKTCSRCGDVVTTEVAALGHDMQVDTESSVDATCVDAGTLVTKCSRCGKVEATAVAALGHTLTDVAAKAATTSTTGNVAYKVCDVCGKIFVDGKEAKLADVTVNAAGGLEFAADGTFKYYGKDGNVNKDFAGMVSFDGGLFFVRNGTVDTSVNGPQSPDGNWYFFANGQVQEGYTGLAEYDDHWFVVKNGKFDLTYGGLFDWNGGTFWIGAGQKTNKNGFEKTEKGMMYFEDGCLIKVTGLKTYDGAIFYVKDGVLQEDFTGTVKDMNGTAFNVVNGMVK